MIQDFIAIALALRFFKPGGGVSHPHSPPRAPIGMIYWYVPWGGGTFFKVGGHKCTSKELLKNFVVWTGNCDVTTIKIGSQHLYTI